MCHNYNIIMYELLKIKLVWYINSKHMAPQAAVCIQHNLSYVPGYSLGRMQEMTLISYYEDREIKKPISLIIKSLDLKCRHYNQELGRNCTLTKLKSLLQQNLQQVIMKYACFGIPSSHPPLVPVFHRKRSSCKLSCAPHYLGRHNTPICSTWPIRFVLDRRMLLPTSLYLQNLLTRVKLIR